MNPWSKGKYKRLARMMARNMTHQGAANMMGITKAEVLRRISTDAYQRALDEVLGFPEDEEEELDDAYYEGILAYPDGECPYQKNDLRRFCAWHAGFHDTANAPQ